jgi:hypothetical protein
LHQSDTGEKWDYSERVYKLFIDFQKAYDSAGRDISYNILSDLEIPMKLAGLIQCV